MEKVFRRLNDSFVSTLFCLALAILGQVSFAVDNPVSYITEINDCDVIKYNGEYYIQGNWLKGDMLRSRNLESWGERTHVFSWNNTWHTQVNMTDPDYDIHGTHIRYDNGLFHLYAHLDVSDGITHATSSNIWGPYIEPVDSAFAIHIDSDTFKDDDGSLYFYSTKFSGGNGNYVRTMTDLWTLLSGYIAQISTTVGSGGWESGTHINEGPKVFKYRDRYYMLYNAYPTSDPDYAIGCVEASSPTGFFNSGKYSAPVLQRITPPGSDEIAYIGQPWMVEGLNGFEKWIGYFGQTTSEGRTQRIDRVHFFDRTFFAEGPTNRYSAGYHPGPANPQLLNLFYLPDGPLPPQDWTVLWASGNWDIAANQARQLAQNSFTFNTVNRDAATNYLIEANVKFIDPVDAEDKCGVLAFYQDDNNWVIVGFDRSTGYGADNWYAHVKEAGVDTVYSGGYAGSVDYSVYHKIRVEKNGSDFHLRIDNRTPPGYAGPISTVLTGAGTPGLYADHAAAAYDGIIYTIGWDEYDNTVTAWGNSINAVAQVGNWFTDSAGIHQSLETGSNYTFKGDLMREYQFSTQVTKDGVANGSMGIFAVAIDLDNYLGAEINQATNELFVYGSNGGVAITPPANVSVSPATSHHIRAVKLSNQVILFVDGEEKMTVNETFGPSQVGLVNQNMAARYNGIMLYRTEPKNAAPWINTDVGAVAFAGDADLREGALYIDGSGTDIWNLNDEFHYAYRAWSGDGEMICRVASVEEAGYWAKGAILFRDSLATNSAMVMLDATSGAGNAQLIWRDAPGLGTPVAEVAGLSYPIWLKLNRTGSLFTAYHSSDGQNWTQIGTCSPPLNATGIVGLGVTAQNNTRIGNAVFDHIASPHGTLPVPAPWQSVDIGSAIHSGSADHQNNVFVVEGGGSGITELADEFHFVHDSLVAEGRITARVIALDSADPQAQAGVMIRHDLAAGSSNHFLSINANGDLKLSLRQAPDSPTGSYTIASGLSLPLWLRLQRVSWLGCELAPYYSTDGVNWIKVVPPNNWHLNCIGLMPMPG